MKRLAFAILLLAISIPGSASAHVLLRDDQSHVGAVLHIPPSDDPVAGEVSNLYFDIQDQRANRAAYESYTFEITNESGETTPVKLVAQKNTLIAHYTFPSQGLYQLDVSSPNSQLHYSLRVERGNGTSQTNQHNWATYLLMTSLGAAAALAILAFNNRREIAKGRIG